MSWYRSRHIGSGGGSGGGATPITPSNSSPVLLVGGETYEPTTNGYAISSYNSITPVNSSPPSLSSGSIYKTGDSGYAIKSYSSITPSNSSPASLSSGSIYKPSSSGYAVSSYSSISPSNSSPVSLSSGSIYRVSSSGYAIQSYTNVSQSGSGSTAISSGAIIKATSSGYFIAGRNSGTTSPSSSGSYFYSGWNYMNSSGYAYSGRPGPNFSETTLWTNSSPTSSFANQTIYVPGWQEYKYLKVYVRYATNDPDSSYGLVDCDALDNEGGDHSVAYISAKYSTNTDEAPYIRGIRDEGYNYIYITRARQLTSAAQSFSTTYCVPTKIVGLFQGYGPGNLLEEELLIEEDDAFFP